MKIYQSNKLQNVHYDVRGILSVKTKKNKEKYIDVFKNKNLNLFKKYTPKQILQKIVMNYQKVKNSIKSENKLFNKKII